MTACLHVCGTNQGRTLSIDDEQGDGGPSGRGQTNERRPIRRPDKVVRPSMDTRMKECLVLSGQGIHSELSVRFSPVAMEAGQGQVRGIFLSAGLYGDNVVHGEFDILPLF